MANNNTFSPDSFEVKKNQIVKIGFTASDKMYDISIPDLGITQVIPKNQSSQVEFQAIKEGSFPIFCRYYCDDSPAVKGTLKVSN
jgi:heme/copper-type cytochrome/quinol oxidase subunit 2